MRALGTLSLHGWLALFRVLFGRRARRTAARPTHAIGVAARGRGTVVASDRPPHPRLAPGRSFEVVLRHANLRFDDDAAVDIRGCAVRLLAEDAIVLDMPMNTGEVSAFWDTRSFVAFVRASAKGTKEALVEFLERNPDAWPGTIGGLCRAPESYARLPYHGQLAYRYRAEGGKEWLVRYRLIAAEGGVAAGLEADDARAPWNHERKAGDERPRDYLRTEFRERVRRGDARYLLQAQFAEAGRARTEPHLAHAGRAWASPWHDLVRIELTSVLDEAETAALGFSLANNPEDLGLVAPRGPSDYHALSWYRARLYPHAQRQRRGLRA